MKPFARIILISSLALAAGCETFKEPQDDIVWLDLNVVGYPQATGSSMYCVKGESEKALHGSESGY